MSDPMIKLRILVRAELALLRIQAERAGAKAALLAVALVFGLVGLGMVNLAGFHALVPRFGPAVGALLVGLANLVLAAVVVAVSRNARLGEGEEKLAQEIRDMAYGELGKDVDDAKAELDRIGTEIERIRTGFAVLKHGFWSGIASFLSFLTKALKRGG